MPRADKRRLGFWYRLAVVILRPPLMLLTKRDWHGQQHVPAGGGAVFCVNHISHFDPLVFAHFLFDSGRAPRFLVKEQLFRVPFVRQVLAGAGQIPVSRESTVAGEAFTAAVEAVRRGECVGVWPEATLTRDPLMWPMVGKTGAARIALATGAPVIPVAQWGAQDVLAPYGRLLKLLPRKTMHVRAGPPVELATFRGQPLTTEVLHQATEAIMAAITALLEQIRHEQAPPVRFDVRKAGLPVTGNPRRRRPTREGRSA